MITGWTDDESPAMPVTALLAASREHRASPLETALARSRADDHREALEAAALAPDPDEHAASLINRGVAPGMMLDLGQRLADTQTELAGERSKIAKGERETERVRGLHERGQIGGLEAHERLSGDFGDAHRAEQLERRADNLLRQLADAQLMIAPPQERLSDVEAAGGHAHRAFVAATRAKMAAAQAGRPAPRPFASRGGFAVRTEPVTCADCIEAGASETESFLLHNDPDTALRPLAAGGAVTYLPYQTDGPTVGEPVVLPGGYS